MSAIKDFSKVWYEKFPGSELPPAWEEDVKSNLAKHKDRVVELEKELQQEQVYVQFLESLLEEVEKRKVSGDRKKESVASSELGQERNIRDVIKDTLERRSLLGPDSLLSTSLDDITGNADALSSAVKEGVLEEEPAEEKRNGSLEKANPPQSDSLAYKHLKQASEEEEQDEGSDEDGQENFVTVIEVNGIAKDKKSNSGIPERPEGTSDDAKRLKKAPPPKPPPKNFKRPTQDVGRLQGPTGRLSFKSFGLDTSRVPEKLENRLKLVQDKCFIDGNGDRNVVFDSKSNSLSSQAGAAPSSSSSSNSSSLSSSVPKEAVLPPEIASSKPPISKKFEGSKLPLPSQTELFEVPKNRRKTMPPVNANVEETVITPRNVASRTEAPNKDRENPPPMRSKIFEMVNKMEASSKSSHRQPMEQLAPNRSFRKSGKEVVHSATNSDALVADYVEPCDLELELGAEQIYDSPPPEVDPPSRNNSLDKGIKPGTSTSTGRSGIEPADLEFEPMYDTVAPDQDNEDDYVVLLDEEANKTPHSNKNSIPRTGAELSHAAQGTDSSTIKSQTSVMSSQSITTTSSGGTASDTEGITESPLPQDGHADGEKHPAANYVNIEYFICKSKRKESGVPTESEDDEPPLMRAISYDQDGAESINGNALDSNMEHDLSNNGSMDRSGVFKNAQSETDLRAEAATLSLADQEKIATYRILLSNIAMSESAYVEVLNKLLQYMKAIKATLSTSKPVLSTDEFNIIFYKIPELFAMHQKFLSGLQQKVPAGFCGGVGMHFEALAREVDVYGAFLQNYSRAVDTVKKCSQNNSDFGDISRSIRLRSLNINSGISLETLLYSPVSRIQKNVEIIQDLLKHVPESHPDYQSLRSALREFQLFLNEFKMIQPEQLSAGSDKNPRHLVKNSFIVELSEGHRKLRHLFLFNDVLVCAKYKASGKNEKFTFELKWYIPVNDCFVVEECQEPRESAPINLVALRSQASTVRDQIKRQNSRDDTKKTKADKQRKKLAELEAQLVLASPNLVFKVKSLNGRAFTFFLSSEYERSQWVDAIEALKKQSSQPPASSQLSMNELQTWLTSCRKHLKTNMGSYLLRTGRDETLLVGDFYVLIGQLKGIQRPADLYICLELDSYGHFFRKAKTKMICGSTQPCWNQDFVIELEGAQNLRILLYEEHHIQGPLIRAKTTIELSRSWMTSLSSTKAMEHKVNLQDYVLILSTRFIPSEMTIRRVPTAKPSGLFGAKVTQVCKREKRQVPFIMTSCVREIERRGINEVGIYRVSGSASDVSRLKKAFETNCYEAEQLLKEVDVHSTTSLFKCYLRELPEALFTDELYPKFFEAFNLHDHEMRKSSLMQLFSTLPQLNQHIILFLLDHMVRINSHENHNKMSLHNLATVFGPTLLRPGTKNESGGNIDLLAAGTADVMAQAGILYFFLSKRANNEPIQFQPNQQ